MNGSSRKSARESLDQPLGNLDWFDAGAGLSLRQAEQAACEAVVSNIFGYHAVQISAREQADDLTAASQVISRHRLHLTGAGQLAGVAVCQTDLVPFASNSVQLVAVQHAQHWCHWNQLLGEIERILTADGVLLLTGVRSRSGRRQLPSMTSPWQLSKQLDLLLAHEFRMLLTRPVFADSRWQQFCQRFDQLNVAPGSWLARIASGYLLVAQKNSAAVPIMRLRKRRLIGGKIGSTATGQLWRKPRK